MQAEARLTAALVWDIRAQLAEQRRRTQCALCSSGLRGAKGYSPSTDAKSSLSPG
jgi:hypothetical protein